jgi:hypothetical protein
MTSLLHPILVLGFVLSGQDPSTSLFSGLPLVGCFALLLGLGYVVLGPMWVRRHRHLHR